MSAGNYDLYIEQGTDFKLSIQVLDSLGRPLNLTGYTFVGKIREFPASSTVLATFTTALQSDPTWLDIKLSQTQTRGLPAPTTSDAPEALAQYVYDLEMTTTEPATSRLLQGNVTVSPEVSY